MMEFLEELDELLRKHKVNICTDDHDSKVVLWQAQSYWPHPTSRGSVLTTTDIGRFKREIEVKS